MIGVKCISQMVSLPRCLLSLPPTKETRTKSRTTMFHKLQGGINVSKKCRHQADCTTVAYDKDHLRQCASTEQGASVTCLGMRALILGIAQSDGLTNYLSGVAGKRVAMLYSLCN
jgi:urease accessory protein UreF